jgi:hypothetical protein
MSSVMNIPNDNPNSQNNNPTPSERVKRLIASLQDAKGQFISVEWFSEPKPSAKHKGVMLRKTTTAVVRTGVAYENLKVIKDAIANGEREEVGSLPWGQWLVYPYAIWHKGTEYIRLTLGANTRPSCVYEVNGVVTDRTTFLSYQPPSASAEREPSEVITVKLESLIKVG